MKPEKRKSIAPLEQAIENSLPPGSFLACKADWKALLADVRERHHPVFNEPG
jgi:hypothetical protein